MADKNWIKIKDKLPPVGVYVLCLFDKPFMHSDRPSMMVDILRNYSSGYDFEVNYIDNYTHWQKLPKLPEVLHG